jgi:hypothetical protein
MSPQQARYFFCESMADQSALIQEAYLAIVLEVLQSIRQAEIARLLSRIYGAPGGTEALDVLMKYMYDTHPYLHLSCIASSLPACSVCRVFC